MIEDVQITFGEWSAWFVALVTAVVLFSVVLFYRRVARTVGRRSLRWLTALRAAAMVALLLCIFRPEIVLHRRQATRDRVVLLVDASRSMSVRDYPSDPDDRFSGAVRQLLAPDGPAARLARTFEVSAFAFDSHPHAVSAPADLQRLRPEGLATDLAGAVAGALQNTPPERIAGVLLLTDGIDNTAGDPVGRIADLGVKVFPVAVGSRLSEQPNYKDIAVEQVEHPRTVPLDTLAEVTCIVRSAGYADRVVNLVLTAGDEEVARQEVVLQGGGREQRVALRFRAKEQGELELVAAVPLDPDERIRENNRSTFHIYVTEPQIRVLYVEGHVRPEFGAVKRALEFDPNVQLVALARIVGSRFNQFGRIEGVQLDGFPKAMDELKPFRVIILGNIDAETFSAEQLRLLAAHVRDEGAGFMMVGGKRSYGPGGYAGTPVEEMLPVHCGGRDAGQEEEPFLLTLTPAGLTHPIFAGCEKYFRADDRAPGVPPLLGCSRLPGPKPGATVLAVNPDRRNENGPLVAVAVGRYGNGRTVASAIDTTYQWDIPLRGLGRDSPFVKFWGQTVRWLAGREELEKGGKGLIAYPDQHFYPVGAEPRILARVSDEQGQATNVALVLARFRREADGHTFERQLPYTPNTRGEYEVKLSPLEPGRYEVKVTASLDEGRTPLGEESFAFRVGEPEKEFERLDLNEGLLKEIARRTGGQYHTLLSLDQLVNSLEDDVERTLVARVVRVWNSPLLFLAIVLLVTSEWILRRRRYLV